MCKQCSLKPVYEFTNKRRICKNCFIKYFQKKVLYTNRKFGLIKSGDVIGYEKKHNLKSVVLENILNMFTERGMIELIKLPSRKKITKTAIPSTIDLESDKIIHGLIQEKISKLKSLPTKGKIIKPLYLFLDKEVLLYAKLKGLKFKGSKVEHDKISKFIEDLESKHPEIKRAIINGWLELNN